MYLTANFEAGFQAEGAKPKKAAANAEGQSRKDRPESHDLGLVVENGHFNDLRDFMQRVQKENDMLHATCAAENAVRARSLPDASALRAEKAAQKKRTENVT